MPKLLYLNIMEAADWSTASTFTKSYHKLVCNDSFAKQFCVKLSRGHWQFLVKNREVLDTAYKGEIQTVIDTVKYPL